MEYRRSRKRPPAKRGARQLPLPQRLPLLMAAGLLLLLLALLARGCAIARGAETPSAEPNGTSAVISLYDDEADAVRTLPLEEYLLGVVAAEMPASFEPEALKAQAVAARTFTLRRLAAYGGMPCGRAGADICTDSACCQAYRTAEALAARWGENAAYYSERIEDAVHATTGEVATYDGALIEALYHSSAGGMTENAENVFASAEPYLISVESPGEEGSAHYAQSVLFPRKSFLTKLNDAFPEAELSAKKLEVQVEVLSRFPSGRVERVRLGKTTVTGRQFRKALDLASANFTLTFVGEDVRIDTKGYGHGVGMSQYGANAMAQAGSSYREILAHYYTGAELAAMETLAQPAP